MEGRALHEIARPDFLFEAPPAPESSAKECVKAMFDFFIVLNISEAFNAENELRALKRCIKRLDTSEMTPAFAAQISASARV